MEMLLERQIEVSDQESQITSDNNIQVSETVQKILYLGRDKGVFEVVAETFIENYRVKRSKLENLKRDILVFAPDVIIVDLLTRDGEDLWEVTNLKECENVPVVALSAYIEELQSPPQVLAYVGKPFYLTTLEHAVSYSLEGTMLRKFPTPID